jgi:GTP cyclohydrolase II
MDGVFASVDCQKMSMNVHRIATSRFPTKYGLFRAHAFAGADGYEHLALVRLRLNQVRAPLVRIHSECITGDTLGSLRCDCGAQLNESLRRIVQAGSGILIYLRGQEGRGIGLANKIRAYALQDAHHDTVSANSALGLPVDARNYGPAVAMLLELGVQRVRLLTNNPKKVSAVEAATIVVEERVPLIAGATVENKRYLQAKAEKLGHLLAQNIEH